MSKQTWIRLVGMLFLMCCGAVAAEPMADRLQACAACHGEHGRSAAEAYYPSIAGKPAGYLHEQLRNFRDGRRHNAVMQQMLAYLSDDYLGEIALYYSTQNPALAVRQKTTNTETLTLGRKLVEQGDPARHLPACQSCHGTQLLGVQPGIPGLLALPPDYLAAQLGAWRVGVREASAPDCMAQVAKRLSEADITAVTAWIASRPVPDPHKPAARLVDKLPLRCGGVQ